MMKKVLAFIKSYNLLAAFQVIAIFLLILIHFILSDIPEYFSGGYELGVIFSSLSIGYSVSFIFFIVNIYIPGRRNKKKVYKHANELTKLISMHGHNLFKDLINKSGQDNFQFESLSSNDISVLCNSINPTQNSPGIAINISEGTHLGSSITWGSNLLMYINWTKENINDLLKYIIYLDSDHIELINEILFSEFFKYSSFIEGGTLDYNDNLESINEHLQEYYNLIKKVDDYVSNHPYMN